MQNKTISRRDRKKQETKKNIIKIASRAFECKGYTQTSMDEIAEQVDIGRSTLFNYFPTKESIIIEIANDEIQELTAFVDELQQKNDSTFDKLRALYTLMIKGSTEYINVSAQYHVLAYLNNSQEAKDIDLAYTSLTKRILMDGYEKGEIKSLENLDNFVLLLRSVFISLLHNGILFGVKGDEEEQMNIMLDIIFGMIA